MTDFTLLTARRLQLLRLLRDFRTLTLQQLIELCGGDPTNGSADYQRVYRDVTTLREAGLVSRQGSYHSLNRSGIRTLIAELEGLCAISPREA